ncbi:MAG: hypothetical protein ACI8ZN_001241 [Bacteroidia bacterium]|jgi:hypothetical protein
MIMAVVSGISLSSCKEDDPVIIDNTVHVLILLIFLCSMYNPVLAQTPGMIFEPATGAGQAVLDPNTDGWVSQSVTGFTTDDQTQSEIAYTSLSFPSNEPDGDLDRGPSCSFTDFVDEGDRDPAQRYLDTSNNWMFRLRMGNVATNAKSYSIMIDTDGKFGSSGPNADLDYTVGNPGFEIEIVLATWFGVYVYDARGTASPTIVRSYNGTTNYQKSIALSAECDNPDYFLDFFVPFAHIAADFGITTSTPLRMAVMSNMAASKSSIGSASSRSDMAGVDNSICGGDGESCLLNLIEKSTPACATNACASSLIRSDCPTITGPISNGATSVSGTSAAADGTIITVYKNGISIGDTTVLSGAWVLNDISPALTTDDTIGASAIATGKSESTNNCGLTIVGVVCSNDPISGAHCGKSIQGIAEVGVVIKVYEGSSTTPLTAGGGTTFASGTPNTITAPSLPSALSPTTDNFLWKCTADGASINCNSAGAKCLNKGPHRVTATMSGQCESSGIWVCVGGGSATATPAITTDTILITTTTVEGTSVANANIILYVDGERVGSVTANGSGIWSIVSMTFTFGQIVTAKAIGTSGLCLSAASASKTVSRNSVAPILTGTYCSTGTINVISGYSTEASGTVIEVFKNGSATTPTTTVNSNGSWTATISSTTFTGGDTITAKSTITGGVQSSFSDSVFVGSKTTNSVIITSSPITEGVDTVIGTGTNTDVITLYVDGVQIGSTPTVSGGVWTVNNIASYDLYASGYVTATATSTGNCESSPSSAVEVACTAPSTSLTVDPADTAICEGSVVSNVRVISSESGIIYQLYNGASKTGASVLGNGADVYLTSGSISTSTTLDVNAVKLSPASCTSALTDSVVITVNPIPDSSLAVSAINPICSGSSSTISIAGSESGYSYQLRDDSDDSPVGSPVIGTGSTINFNTGNLTANKTYNIYATGPSPTACPTELTNTASVTVVQPGSWLGTTDTDWFTSSNWCGGIPTVTTDVNIPAIAPNMPDIDASGALCKDMSIESGATVVISTSDVLSTYGNWTNNGTFTSGTGGVSFDASVAQSITGATIFGKLIMNNASSTGLTLNNPISVTSGLTLTDGNIYSTTSDIINLGASATVSGASDQSYLSGPVTKTSSSTSGFILPTGKDGEYRPVTITPTSSSTTEYSAEYFKRPYTDVSTINSPLTKVSQIEYFNVSRLSGTSDASIALSWGANSGVNTANVNELTAARWNGSTWIEETGTGSGTSSSGTVSTSSTVTGFGDFTIGNTGSNINPLPVELIVFKGQRIGNEDVLTWSTASENKNAGFGIEFKRGSTKWFEVSWQDGYGSKSTISNYAYNHNCLPDETRFYRLRQQDFDGSIEYSSTIKLDAKLNENIVWNIFPNPSEGSFAVTGLETGMQVIVQNTTGQIIYQSEISTEEININLGPVTKGIYFVTYRGFTGSFTKRLIIQ